MGQKSIETGFALMSALAEPTFDYIQYDDFLGTVRSLSRQVAGSGWKPDFIIGIGRGGLAPAVYISHELNLPMLSVDHSSRVPGFADDLLATLAAKSAQSTRLLFVDDINDSGGTIEYIRKLLADGGAQPEFIRFAVLINNECSRSAVDYWAEEIDRTEDKRWFVFPWEAVSNHEVLVEEAFAVPERLA
jgi:uncharacterized protein